MFEIDTRYDFAITIWALVAYFYVKDIDRRVLDQKYGPIPVAYMPWIQWTSWPTALLACIFGQPVLLLVVIILVPTLVLLSWIIWTWCRSEDAVDMGLDKRFIYYLFGGACLGYLGNQLIAFYLCVLQKYTKPSL